MSYFVHESSYIDDDVVIGEGTKIWYFCHIQSGARIGKNCSMGQNVNVSNNVTIGDNCRIQNNVSLYEGVTLEDDVLIGPDVFITDHNHGMNPTKKGGYSAQSLIVKDVVIKTGVWLGQRVCVLPGVTIGAHSIIGANSVVTHDVPSYAIAVGAPARVVKKWDKERKEWVTIEEKRR